MPFPVFGRILRAAAAAAGAASARAPAYARRALPATAAAAAALFAATAAPRCDEGSPVAPARATAVQPAAPLTPEERAARMANMRVFSGSANRPLAQEVADELGIKLGTTNISRFADGEISIQVNDTVRGKDVFIIQSTSQPVNENLVELLLMVSTMRRASAKSITCVMPYPAYKRDVGCPASTTQQLALDTAAHAARTAPPGGDMRRLLGAIPDAPGGGSAGGSSSAISRASGSGSGSGGSSASHGPCSGTSGSDAGLHRSAYPISAADVAILLQTMGADRIITVDMRLPGQGQSEGFFAIPVENVRSTRLAIEHVARLKPKLANTVVVAPNEMCIQLAHDFQRGLARRTGEGVGLAAIIEAGPSRGADRYVHRHTGPLALQEDADRAVPKLEIVGDVKGCDVVLVDDLIDTGTTLVRRLDALRDAGARRIVAYATHGLFSGSALQRISHASHLTDVIVTNTIPLRDDLETRHTHKIAQLSVAPVIAQAMMRVQTRESLQDLRVFDRDTDIARYRSQE